MKGIGKLTTTIETMRAKVPASNVVLVGISGIDASGKGFITRQLGEKLEPRGHRCSLINADAWLNLPGVRFSETERAKQLYNHALRLDPMFEQLIQPLKMRRSIDLTFDRVDETADAFRPDRYEFKNVDIVLLEGIFLFKSKYVHHFDLKIWIECSFDTALERAIARGQEGLPPAETLTAYHTVYFPAQRLHFDVDDPRTAADIDFPNL